MDNEQTYIETFESVDETAVKKEPRGRAVLSLVFGMISIILGDLVGMIFGILARRLSCPLLEDFPNTVSAKFARAGRVMGTIGIALSAASMFLLTVLLVIAVWLIVYFTTGDPLFGISVV